MEVLDRIPLELDLPGVVKALGGSQGMERCAADMLELVRPVARPKAVYAARYVDSKNRDSVRVQGVTFTSTILAANLEHVHRVFPFVATCGTEVDELEAPPDDLLAAFCLDAIKLQILGSVWRYLDRHVKATYALGRVSTMSPGRLENWPISEQQQLFSLLGDVEGAIGVRLTESHLMVPLKSSSGLYFPTEVSFESCRLCPRENCESRKAEYDPALVQKYERTTA